MKYRVLVGVILAILLISGFVQQAPAQVGKELEAVGLLKKVIKVKAEGIILNYQALSAWEESKFSEILQSKEDFKSKQIEQFNKQLSRYNLYATNYEMEFDESEKTTLLKCEVRDAVSKSGNRYTARFQWLLEPLGLDFIEDHFKKHRDGLSWEGKVNGVPTTIIIKAPPRKSPYKAWHHPNGHCHFHVWWCE
jgi:hypothetical protein